MEMCNKTGDKNQNKFKVLLWDIDYTLIDLVIPEQNAIRESFKVMNLGECPDDFYEKYHVVNQKWWDKLEKGEKTKQEILEGRFYEMFSVYSLDSSRVPEFNKNYMSRLADTVCLNPNAFETLQALDGKVEQYIVTNGSRFTQDKKLNNSGFGKFIKRMFISDDIGAEKPSRLFFDKVLSLLPPYCKDQILVIGDSLTSDIQGANNSKLPCCWYNPNHKKPDPKLRIDYEITDLIQVLDIVLQPHF